MLRSRKSRRGFGAWDLMLVAVIVALVFILVAFVASGVNNVREAATRTQTNNNLKQAALAVHSCNDVYRQLPPAFEKFGPATFPASVHIHLTPYMESSPFFKDFLGARGEGAITMTILPYYTSPSDSTIQGNGAGVQNFAANLRVFAAKGFNTAYDAPLPPLEKIEAGPKAAIRDLTDGTGNTIFFVTKFATCADGGSYYAADPASKWAAFFGQNPALKTAHASDPTATFQLRPASPNCLVSPLMAQSFQASGLSVALGDGSVRMIDPTFSAEIWNRVLQPNDGKELMSEWCN
jgi:hypothetical protein